MSNSGHGWANPGPAGLVALSMACFIFFAIQTGQVTHGAVGLMGIWLLGGFVIQVIVGLIELKEGNTTGGNVFIFFSAFFMLVTGLGLMFKFFAGINGWNIDPRVDGWAWLALTASLTLWSPAYFKSPKAMTALVFSILPALWIITFTDLGLWPKTLVPICGWLLFISGWIAIYTAAAVILNTAFKKVILPLGSPLVKDQPVQANSKSV